MRDKYSLNNFKINIVLVICSTLFQASHQEQQCGSRLTSSSGQISTPNYPNSYPRHLTCEWHIQVSNRTSILLVFKDFFTYEQDNLLLYDGHEADAELAGNFSETNYPKHFVSKHNQLLLRFSTKSYPRKGFDIRYETLENGCGGTYTDQESVISSPGYPKNYYENLNCEWTVNCPENRTIFVKLLDLHLQMQHAHLAIFDGNSMQVIANISGSSDTTPTDLMTQTNKLVIRFRSDHSVEANHFRGFSLSYSSLTVGSNTSLVIMATNTVVITQPNQTLTTFYTPFTELHVIHYDMDRKRLLLFDPESHKLLPNFPSERGTAVYARPECLTYDPIHGLLFWIDVEYHTINAMDISREMSATLLQLESTNSRHLIVNSERSVLIWSDIGSNPKISQIDCDGTNQKTLYSRGRQAMHLTVDYQTQRYYFVDITDYSLIAIDFNGENEMCLMTSRTFFGHIISMSLLDNDLYLANHHMIYKIPQLQRRINRAEIIYTSDNLDNTLAKSEFFYQINPVNLKRSLILGFRLIDNNLARKVKNKCDKVDCDGICLPNSRTYRCISQSLTTIPSAVSIDYRRDSNSLAIFNTILMLVIIASIVLVTFYLSQRITKLHNQFHQVIKPCVTFTRGSIITESTVSHDYANNLYEDPVYVVRNNMNANCG